MDYESGSDIIAHGFNMGINFIDTAQLYGTYEYIRRASEKSGVYPVVSTKSYAYDKKGAMEALEKARKGLDRDVVDIFMLHEQETELTLKGHREALEYYLAQKAKGKIRAVGVSTHRIEVVKAASRMPEVDVVHPLYNKSGVGIGDGTVQKMEDAITKAAGTGKGIFSMKPLGGGSLIGDYYESMDFVLSNRNIHSVAIGMKSVEEVDMNVAYVRNGKVPEDVEKKVSLQKRALHVEFWCEKCGRCIPACGQGALSMTEKGLWIDREKCVLCGYCCAACPEFALKIF
jgi:aryl-alcohol dehydrogenase-like predicted oxidoreductase